jgi:hypothetical protein
MHTDDYGRKFITGSRVVRGHYLELVPRHDRMYYLESGKEVMVLMNCVVSVLKSDSFQTSVKLVKGKNRQCFAIDANQHEIYLNLMLESN